MATCVGAINSIITGGDFAASLAAYIVDLG
jgi:hypothetical protein